MAGWVQRMVGAAKLDAATYEEVEADKGATWQALGVVVLSAVGAGIGGAIHAGGRGFLGVLISSLVAWVVWALVTWVVGTMFLPQPQTRSNVGELLRTIGFAQSPGVLRVFGAVPFVGWLLNLAVWVWMLAAMVVAVRQALDYTGTGRAVAVCVIGWLIAFSVAMVTALFLGVTVALLGTALGV
jgi:hypothetical protein